MLGRGWPGLVFLFPCPCGPDPRLQCQEGAGVGGSPMALPHGSAPRPERQRCHGRCGSMGTGAARAPPAPRGGFGGCAGARVEQMVHNTTKQLIYGPLEEKHRRSVGGWGLPERT